MSAFSNWTPPAGRPLRVTIVARISTAKQDPASLVAQANLCRRHIIQEVGDIPIEWNVLSSEGSGERLDRPELHKLEQLIENRQTDVIIAEDLGRIMRRTRALLLCEDCEDANIRLIAINDRIDTTEKYRLPTMFAALKHEESNADTSQRLKRQLDHNFMNGGCIQHRAPGLLFPTGSKKDSDLYWDPKYRRLYRVMFYLAQYRSVLQIRRWLNARGVKINNKQVRRLLSNRIFIGERVRGRTLGKRDNKSGRYKRYQADSSNQKVRPVPHLQIIRRERFERLQRHLDAINHKYTVGADGRPDPRKGRPKKATKFPGQRVTCGICGGPFYWGGNGQTDHMMCSNARASAEKPCWVKASFDGNVAGKRIGDIILDEVERIEGFDELLADLVRREAEQIDNQSGDRVLELRKQLGSIETQIKRACDAIMDGLLVEELKTKAAELKRQQSVIQAELDALERKPRSLIRIPTAEEMKALARRAMDEVLNQPSDVSHLVDRLIRKIVVLPYRPIDHGDIVFRAQVEIDLSALITIDDDLSANLPLLRRDLTIDLFTPPQRIEIRKRALEIRAASPSATHKQIAAQIGKVTFTAVQRAFKLDELMNARGVSDEYEIVRDPVSSTSSPVPEPPSADAA